MRTEKLPREAFLYYALIALIDEMGGVTTLPIADIEKQINEKALYMSYDDNRYYLEVGEPE